MPTNHYFQSGSSFNNRNEQNLIEGMVQEVIKQVGFDLYYIPRNVENFDSIFGEDTSAYFDRFSLVEMYLENVDGFGGDGAMLSKFGLELRETVTFTVARKRWDEAARKDPNLILPNRPAEADLLYFPLTKSFFEIRRVEHANPFYQLGKLYVYKLSCELYQYSHESFFTGDADVDAINVRTTDQLQNLVLDEIGHAFLTEQNDYVLRDDYSIKKIDTLSDNEELANRASTLIDFSVRNPFAELERKG